MCHTAYHFVQSAPLGNVHSNESLVWLKTDGFWRTIITGPLHKLLSDTLLVPQVMRTLWLTFHKISLFTCSNKSQIGQMLWWVNSRSRMWVLDIAKFGPLLSGERQSRVSQACIQPHGEEGAFFPDTVFREKQGQLYHGQ